MGSGVSDLMFGRSSSSQGLPKPLQDLIVNLFATKGSMGGKLIPQFMGGLSQATQGFNRAPKMIDQMRKQQDLAARRDMMQPMQGAMDAMWRNAAGRGATNSSTVGQGLGEIGNQFARTAAQQAAQSGQWAGGAKLQNMQNRFNANLQGMGMLGDWMGLSRYGSSSSITPTNPFGFGMFGGGGGGGGMLG